MFTRYFAFLVLFAAAVRGGAASDLAREIILTSVTGDAPVDVEIRKWQGRAGAVAAPLSAYEQLGWAFVAKARQTLDPGFYKLAEKTADVIDAQFGLLPEAALLRGHVYHNLHRFRAAEAIARRLVAERGTAQDLALLSDALMEQGKLSDAIEALQRLVNLKPGPEADSRIAQLRWLKGDLRGAISAMEQAARATSPRDAESLAWMYVRLAGFYLLANDVNRADAYAAAAVRTVNDYAPALLAEGKVRVAQRRWSEAVVSLTRAVELNPLPEYQWWLADAYRQIGATAKAESVENEIASRGELGDPRTLALFLATHRRGADRATALAYTELENRRDAFSYDAAAWAAFAAGDIGAAKAQISKALAEGTIDPRVLLHAALIADAAGVHDEALAFAAASERGGAALLPGERRLLNTLARDARGSVASPLICRTHCAGPTALSHSNLLPP